MTESAARARFVADKRISTSLYHLSDELQRLILEAVDPESGELLEGYEQKLDAMGGEVRAKIVQVALYVLGLRTEAQASRGIAAAIAAQAQVHTDSGAVLDRQADRLEAYLDTHMEALELDEIKDPRVRVWYQNSKAVEVLRPDLVPEEYLLPPKPPAPSKKKLADAMKLRNVETLEAEDPGYPGVTYAPSTYARLAHRRNLKVK